jgi:hypothetical protein
MRQIHAAAAFRNQIAVATLRPQALEPSEGRAVPTPTLICVLKIQPGCNLNRTGLERFLIQMKQLLWSDPA